MVIETGLVREREAPVIIDRLGAFLFGACVGALPVWVLVELMLVLGKRAPVAWTAYVPLVWVAMPVGAVVGGVASLLWARRSLRVASLARFGRGGVVVLVASFFLSAMGRMLVDGRRETLVRAELSDAEKAGWRRWEESFGARYAARDASLAGLFGPLLVADARLVAWEPADSGLPGWSIRVRTSRSLDEVLAFFMSVLPEGLEQYPFRFHPGLASRGSWRSLPQRSSDGRETEVWIERRNLDFDVRYVTTVDRALLERYVVDSAALDADRAGWVEPLAVLQSRVGAGLRQHEAEAHSTFGELIYPGAQFGPSRWTGRVRLPELSLRTSDDLDRVAAYYRTRLTGLREEHGERFFETTRAPDGVSLKVYLSPVRGGTQVQLLSGR